jgi:tRNA threonylcarbamoyladenosine biosynthesis protein TsaE
VIAATTASEGETRSLGRRIAEVVTSGDVLLLVGGLGSGKTTFVKGLAEGLGCKGEVTSPTFTLCHTYAGRLDLVHVDMWRLERRYEILDLALEEELERGAVLVAEWGEAAEPIFGSEALEVTFAEGEGEDERAVTFLTSPSWEPRLPALRAAVAA